VYHVGDGMMAGSCVLQWVGSGGALLSMLRWCHSRLVCGGLALWWALCAVLGWHHSGACT